jgi:hypothetical protein
MKGPLKERWMTLCEQAAVEQDTQKLMALIQEINRLLEEKEQRLHRQQESRKRGSPQQSFLGTPWP